MISFLEGRLTLVLVPTDAATVILWNPSNLFVLAAAYCGVECSITTSNSKMYMCRALAKSFDFTGPSLCVFYLKFRGLYWELI